MSEVLKYNKQGNLVEVVELSKEGSVISLHSFNENKLFKFWDQEVDGERECFMEYIEYQDEGRLTSMRMNGYRWTRVVKKNAVGLEYPKEKDRVSTSNGEFVALKIRNDFLKSWKNKITPKTT